MFKVGDHVICVNSDSQNVLCEGETYVVKYVGSNLIGFEFDDCDAWYSDRFILDIKKQRKKKLENLCLK